MCCLRDACVQQAVNHLRYECVPVAITEGRAPAEKFERLQQRCKNLLTRVAYLREVRSPLVNFAALVLWYLELSQPPNRHTVTLI